mmetsp:Transcript_6926/g.17939  ORF Transcript_6926/g.17939 Transcript_6926/m.17939 type:complete len:88 (+) Transcript_6926:118-381(+)
MACGSITLTKLTEYVVSSKKRGDGEEDPVEFVTLLRTIFEATPQSPVALNVPPPCSADVTKRSAALRPHQRQSITSTMSESRPTGRR